MAERVDLELLLKTLDLLPVGVVIIGCRDRIRFCNHAADSLLNQSETSPVGKSCLDVFPPEFLHVRSKSGSTELNVGMGLQRTVRWTYQSLEGIPDVTGLVFLLDVSEGFMLKQECKSLKELVADLEVIFDNSSDEIFVTDGHGTTLRVNAACERLYGVPCSDLIGKNVEQLEKEGTFFPSLTPKVKKLKEKVTVVQRTRSGRKVLATANPVLDSEGNIIRIITNSRDVSEFYDLKVKLAETESLMQRYMSEVEMLRKECLISDDVVVKSRAMYEVVDTARRIAPFDSTVLLQGETGTGKDVVAKLIHKHSSRSSGPYIKINCGAVPETLIESEFFGYASGAFTGAQRGGKPGVFEMAHGGTLFLNEIDTLPLSLQAKLLHVIQECQFMRVGGTKAISVDVRFIAASNQDLLALVKEGAFREDLYYRLNVVSITIPPLRERREDVPALTVHFLERLGDKYGIMRSLSSEAMEALVSFNWPGNVRELENAIERSLVISTGSSIGVWDLPERIRCYQADESESIKPTVDLLPVQLVQVARESLERELLIHALKEGGSTRAAARILGVSQSTVVRRMKKYSIQSPRES